MADEDDVVTGNILDDKETDEEDESDVSEDEEGEPEW